MALEGTLSKWTNVMKGWQNRWFVLEIDTSLLSYYTVSSAFESIFKEFFCCVFAGRHKKLMSDKTNSKCLI